MARTDLKSMTVEKLQYYMEDIGEPKFRAKQIFQWIHQKNVDSFDQMTNIPKSIREKLSENTKISNLKIAEKYYSKKDDTVKYLFALENDNVIESVLMRYSYGNAVCVSSQAGCRMGCAFCASTIDGLEYNLLAGEMLSQVYKIQEDTGERVSSVVLMGSGEPLDNYKNVLNFINIINSKDGIDIGQRHITLSTCGIADKIDMLRQENLQITLAVSLHAPNDEIRNSIMPVSKKYNIKRLLKACKEYSDFTKRRITFEYSMIKGVNDSIENANELASILKNMLCHVNLIPINDVKERGFVKSDDYRIQDFAAVLNSKGIQTTVRRKLGSDINAACGQLRRGYMNSRR